MYLNWSIYAWLLNSNIITFTRFYGLVQKSDFIAEKRDKYAQVSAARQAFGFKKMAGISSNV